MLTGALFVVGCAPGIGSRRPSTAPSLCRGCRERQIAADARTTGEWLWETDPGGRFTYSNGAVEHLLGSAPEDLLGMSTIDLTADEADREFVRRVMDDPIVTLPQENIRAMSWRHRDGHAVVLQGSTVVLFDERDQAIGIRGSRRRLSSEASLAREAAVAHRRVSAVLVTAAFDAALQPIVSLSTGRIVGAEALARFRDGRSPDLGFADARRAGLPKELEVQAFAAALTVFDALPDTAYLSANASPEVLMDASWGHPPVTQLGLDIGASLTGEGPETLEQLDALNTLGVEQAQGYALARPTTDRQVWAHWAQRTWHTHLPRVDLRSLNDL